MLFQNKNTRQGAPPRAHPRAAPTATGPPKLLPLDFLTGIYSISSVCVSKEEYEATNKNADHLLSRNYLIKSANPLAKTSA